ncbi:hypothetical protein EVAR_100829_1 [Eumeta japonica]|uniref:Uncharacterized protein n=1 Tax=Eumeta variegata TaxID=151549 RepID=A0A4C1SXN9_EUMVA|nr:hypothetical protein EVAR_100829_1 [Eumeta japonica]
MQQSSFETGTSAPVFQMYKTSLCQKSSGSASLGILGDLRYFSTSLRELLLLRVDRGSSSSDSLIIFSQTLQRPPLAVISELVLGGMQPCPAFSEYKSSLRLMINSTRRFLL